MIMSATPYVSGLCVVAALLAGAVAASSALPTPTRAFAARRSADDARLVPRGAPAEPEIIVGRFKAPAMLERRVAKSSAFGAQTVGASLRVADNLDAPSVHEAKVVHGQQGASAAAPQSRYRTVSAKMVVSDEGMNLPPSKLSADIYGNVAEIVTAPPESVDQDLFQPPDSQLFRTKPSKRSHLF